MQEICGFRRSNHNVRHYSPLFFLTVVSGSSMEPTLLAGDRLLVRRVYSPSERLIGHIVVARDPRNANLFMVKRAVALKEESFVLLGDNPNASTDSRTLGEFPSECILGKVIYRYHPLSRAGHIS